MDYKKLINANVYLQAFVLLGGKKYPATVELPEVIIRPVDISMETLREIDKELPYGSAKLQIHLNSFVLDVDISIDSLFDHIGISHANTAKILEAVFSPEVVYYALHVSDSHFGEYDCVYRLHSSEDFISSVTYWPQTNHDLSEDVDQRIIEGDIIKMHLSDGEEREADVSITYREIGVNEYNRLLAESFEFEENPCLHNL